MIFDIIEKEHQRQLKGIELIASENFVSDQVMQAMGSCLTNKYAEGYPGKRYYGGCEVVDQSEQIAIDRLKQIFGAEWANVQPHSGAQANAAVFLAVLNPGDKFMGLNLAHGGHLSHGSLVNTSGIIYTPCEYNLNKETGRVDYDQMEEIALREKPKMIIGGGSAYSREWDYKRMREIADKVGAILLLLFLTALCIEWLSHFLTELVQGERAVSRRAGQALAAVLGAVFLLCALLTDPPDFTHTSLRAIQSMALGLLCPEWSFFFKAGETGLCFLLLETAAIALLGTCMGSVVALPLAFLNTSRLMPRPVAAVFRGLVIAIRSVPFLIYGLIFIRVTGPGAFTGVLTLSLCSVGLLCKRFTEALEALDFRAYRALADMGVPLLLRIRYALFPQLRAAFASAVLYRFDMNIREAAVLGLVGAGGIGAPMIFAMNQYAWGSAGAIALGLILLVWGIDLLSAWIRRKIG